MDYVRLMQAPTELQLPTTLLLTLLDYNAIIKRKEISDKLDAVQSVLISHIKAHPEVLDMLLR